MHQDLITGFIGLPVSFVDFAFLTLTVIQYNSQIFRKNSILNSVELGRSDINRKSRDLCKKKKVKLIKR